MKNAFLHGLDYNQWANSKIIDVLKSNKNSPRRCLQLISHIISVQDYWYEKLIKKNLFIISLWENYTLIECSSLSINSSETWKKYVNKSKEKDFTELCGYFNENLVALDITIGDVINHVLNHSAYHRGQINVLLKQNDIKPAEIDFHLYASF